MIVKTLTTYVLSPNRPLSTRVLLYKAEGKPWQVTLCEGHILAAAFGRRGSGYRLDRKLATRALYLFLNAKLF